ncbi:MAG: hypothetical protein IJD51_06520 [Clostridia bacterium]|nr:hypothetical protein [Clostridia bacterium]
MIYPTVDQLSGGKFNRYEVVVGVAKCARLVTDEYVEMKEKAQKLIDTQSEKASIASLIDPEYKDQKAVKIAVGRIIDGRYKLVRTSDKK